jgi:NAD+ kinase
LRDFLQSSRPQKLLQQVQEKCILVLGWDGTMLRAIGQHHSENIPFLWVNFGHKGFLLNDYSWIEWEPREYESRQYPLLDVSQNSQKLWSAFNDINIYSPEGKAIAMDVDIGAWNISLWWDGVVIATPAGSTWHSKSYGWPILPHKSENLVISPKWNIWAQTPKVIDNPSPISIKNTKRKFPFALNIDGVQQFISGADEDVEIQVQKSSHIVHLLISKEHTRDWDNKVLTEQGFNS